MTQVEISICVTISPCGLTFGPSILLESTWQLLLLKLRRLVHIVVTSPYLCWMDQSCTHQCITTRVLLNVSSHQRPSATPVRDSLTHGVNPVTSQRILDQSLCSIKLVPIESVYACARRMDCITPPSPLLHWIKDHHLTLTLVIGWFISMTMTLPIQTYLLT